MSFFLLLYSAILNVAQYCCYSVLTADLKILLTGSAYDNNYRVLPITKLKQEVDSASLCTNYKGNIYIALHNCFIKLKDDRLIGALRIAQL